MRGMSNLGAVFVSPVSGACQAPRSRQRVPYPVSVRPQVARLVGTVADVQGRWQHLGFFPNLLTAALGFCFGVPTTLVVLNWLETQREERKLQALSDGAWSDFSLRVKDFCSDERIRVLSAVCPRIYERWREIYTHIMGYFNAGEHAKIWPLCEGWAAELDGLLKEVSACIPDHEGLVVEFAGVQSGWTLLDADVRVRRIEMRVKNAWLQGRFDPHIRQKVVPQENAITEFLRHNNITSMSNGMPDIYKWPADVRDLPNFLRYCGTTKNIFANTSVAPVNSVPSRQYADAARDAATFLQILKGAVRYAETFAEWPKSSKLGD
jgi:hypothetical protein